MGLIVRQLRILLAALLLAVAAGAQAADPVERVMQETLGPSPARAFHYVQALRELKRTNDADLLERYLLNAYLDELGGQPHEGFRTVATGIRLAQYSPSQAETRLRWQQRVPTVLALAPIAASREPPAQLAGMSPPAVELAPGLWSEGFGLHVQLTAVNKAPAPLALPRFGVTLGSARFGCGPQRGEATVRLLQPGQQVELLCSAGRDREAALAALAQARANPALLTVESDALVDADRRREVVDALVRSQDSQLQRVLGKTDPAATAASASAAHGKPFAGVRGWLAKVGDALTLQSMWGRGTAVRFFLVLGAIGLYWLLAQAIGNGGAAFLSWLGGTLYVVALIARTPLLALDSGHLASLLLDAYLLVLPMMAAGGLYMLTELIAAQRRDPEEFERQARNTLVVSTLQILWRWLTGRR